jgi:hypothetical protein
MKTENKHRPEIIYASYRFRVGTATSQAAE